MILQDSKGYSIACGISIKPFIFVFCSIFYFLQFGLIVCMLCICIYFTAYYYLDNNVYFLYYAIWSYVHNITLLLRQTCSQHMPRFTTFSGE